MKGNIVRIVCHFHDLKTNVKGRYKLGEFSEKQFGKNLVLAKGAHAPVF